MYLKKIKIKRYVGKLISPGNVKAFFILFTCAFPQKDTN